MKSLHPKLKIELSFSIHLRQVNNRNKKNNMKMKNEKKEKIHEILRVVTEVSKAIYSILRLFKLDP